MSADKGKRAGRWVASYLRTQGWPLAEAVANGRAGVDITETPGVALEIKTGTVWRHAWLEQAGKYDGKVQAVVWLLPGAGAASVSRVPVIMPGETLQRLLLEAGRSPGYVLSLPVTGGIQWRAAWRTLSGPIFYQPPAPADAQGIMQMHELMQVLRDARYM